MPGIYLKLGSVKGDATDDNHKEWIQCNSFQFGVGRGISTPVGAGKNRDVSHPSVSEIVVTKLMDVASMELFRLGTSEMKGMKAEVHFVRTGSDTSEIYCTAEMENALISGYSMSSGGDRPSESLSLNFTKITWDYKGSKETNDAGSSFKAGYDLAAAKKV